MSAELQRATRLAVARPGVVKALGIANVVCACLILAGLVMELFWLLGLMMVGGMAGPRAGGPKPSPMMGMDEPGFVWFCLADALTGLAVNLPMLASGVGLMNVRRWGARLWAGLAWIKIARLVALGATFVVAVSPVLSASMARSVVAMMGPRGAAGPGATVAEMTTVYAIMCLIMTAVMVFGGVIYPAATLWLLGRPGVKAAFPEPEESPTEPEPS